MREPISVVILDHPSSTALALNGVPAGPPNIPAAFRPGTPTALPQNADLWTPGGCWTTRNNAGKTC